MTNIKMSTTNDVFECTEMTMNVIYSFQWLISLQVTGISFSSRTISFCGGYFCVLGIMEVAVFVSYMLVVGLVDGA
jgi:hypothetical protein